MWCRLRRSLLMSRGLSVDDQNFFATDYEQTIHPPAQLFDLTTAAERIRQAVEQVGNSALAVEKEIKRVA